MLFCNACGRELTEHDSICPECGAVIRKDTTIDEKYKYGLPVLLSSIVLSATLFSILSEVNPLYLFLLIPIMFIGRDFSKPLMYVVDGILIGFIISEILLSVYKWAF